LGVDPGSYVVAAVEDAAAEAEAARARPEVSPVPQRGDGSAEDVRSFCDGQQFGFVAGGVFGHGSLRVWSVVDRAFTGEGADSDLSVTLDCQLLRTLSSCSPVSALRPATCQQ
jgi:hypothetical protein